MSRQHHGDVVQGALVSGLLVAATLGAAACGGDGSAHDSSPTATPAGRAQPPAATVSPTRSGRALPVGPPRTPDAVVKHFVGRQIKVAGRTIPIAADTITCGGLGRPSKPVHDHAAWTRFRCIQPTFPAGRVVGPDLIFVVQSVAPRALIVTRRHLTRYYARR